MGNYQELKDAVSEVIKTNGSQEITGDVLQNTLLTIISIIGVNATFAGIATPETNPGTPDQNVFYIADVGTYPNFGNKKLTGLSVLTNRLGTWSAIRIMPVNNSGVKAIINNANSYIQIDTQNKTITIPVRTRCVSLDGTVYTFNAETYNLPQDSGNVGFTNIFFNKKTKGLEFQSINNPEFDVNLWRGDEYFWIGCIEIMNTINNIVYLLSPKYVVDGKYYGYFFTKEKEISNSGVNRIITNKNTYISFNSSDNTITIPNGARFVTNDKQLVRITNGTFNLPNDGTAYVAFTNIFVRKSDGEIQFQNFNSWDESYWNDEYCYIGSYQNTSTVNLVAYLLADIYKVDDEFVGIRAKEQTTQSIIPQIYNTPIRRKEITEPLKICCFGSSWFMDTWWYLNKILQSAGINAELTCFYTGGAYFSQWIDRYNNNQSIDCWKSTNGSDWVKTTALFKDTLNEEWDIIGFQQGAFQSIKWESEWLPYIEDVVSIVKRSCGVDTIIAFNSTWTPAISGNLSPFSNDKDGQKEWQQLNYDNVKKFMAISGIDNVCPNGATMWAMRQNNQLNISNDMADDTLHPNNGLPIYALAGTFFETYIAPMYGVSFNNVEWMPNESTQKAPVSGASWQNITEHQRELIRNIIRLSLSNRFGFQLFK